MAPSATLGTDNANAAFTALNNAFLISNGNQRYYKTSLNNAEKDYFWRQALDIQAVEDVYDSNPTTDTRTLVGGLLDTFLQQNQGGGGLYDWNWNDYNDDMLWAGLAFARGYRVTGNQTYLNQAKYAFDRAYNRGWDSALGGGIWWSVGKNEKSALSNGPAVILGCLIYESNGDSSYLTKARAIYDWTWNTLLDRSTGAVHEKIQANGNLDSGETVYSWRLRQRGPGDLPQPGRRKPVRRRQADRRLGHPEQDLQRDHDQRAAGRNLAVRIRPGHGRVRQPEQPVGSVLRLHEAQRGRGMERTAH